MGYTTKFKGEIDITPKPTEQITTFVNGLMDTRRMMRDVNKLPPVDEQLNPLKTHGVEGEFYFNQNSKSFGQNENEEKGIVNYNEPPSTQPSLWLQWEINKEGKLRWNKAEKFYEYKKWLIYLIENVFKPFSYTLNGKISFQGEDSDDEGYITVENNVVSKSFEPIKKIQKGKIIKNIVKK